MQVRSVYPFFFLFFCCNSVWASESLSQRNDISICESQLSLEVRAANLSYKLNNNGTAFWKGSPEKKVQRDMIKTLVDYVNSQQEAKLLFFDRSQGALARLRQMQEQLRNKGRYQ